MARYNPKDFERGATSKNAGVQGVDEDFLQKVWEDKNGRDFTPEDADRIDLENAVSEKDINSYKAKLAAGTDDALENGVVVDERGNAVLDENGEYQVNEPSQGEALKKTRGDVLELEEKHAEPTSERSPRELFYERVRTNIPDGRFDEDEDEYFRGGMNMLDRAEEDSRKYKDLTEKLLRRYKEDPEEVAALLDYIDGMPLAAAIRKHKGDEALTLKEGDEGWNAFRKAGEERKAERERQDAMMKEIDGNMSASLEEFDSWAKEQNLDEEQKSAVWDLLTGDLNEMGRGKFGRNVFDRYRDALNRDKDLEGARAQGYAEGKNEKIDERRHDVRGSGLPGVSSSAVQEIPSESAEDATVAFLNRARRRR